MAQPPLMNPEAASAEGFVASTSDTVPCVEEGGPSSSACGDAEEEKLPCAFYMRTGTCAYGDRCKFSHPEDRPEVFMNSRGLPLRPAEPECSFYVRNGWCSFSDTCKFHHPELPDRHTAETWGSPTAAAGSDQRQEGVRPAADLSLQERGQKVHHSRPRTNVKPQQGPTYVAHPHMLQPMSPYGLAPPGMMMPYGYYHPAMSPHARMFPPVTAAMTYPMYHMRPYMSMPMAGPPVQLAQQMQQMTIYNPSSSSRSGSSSRHRPQQGYSSSSGRGGRSGHLRGGGVGDSSGARRRTAAAAAADDDEEGVSAAVDTTTARDTS